MQYNYDFEIASLLIMCIIGLHFVCIRQFPMDKTRLFGQFLIACIGECAANILSCVGLANAALVPQWVNEALAFAFFVLEGLSSYLLFRYFMEVCELRGRRAKQVWCLGGIPFLLFLAFALLTPFIGFFYYFIDNVYYQGFGADLGYAYIIYFFVLNILIIAKRRRVVSLRTKLIIALYTVVAVSMVWAQFHVRGVLLTSVGNATVLLMLYLAMQNPSEMLDPVTQIGNEQAFFLQLRNMQNHKAKKVIITVHLCKFRHIQMMLGLGNSNEILGEIGSFLYRLCGKFHVFRTYGDTFTVLVDSEERAEEIEQRILERFGQDWTLRENHVALETNLIEQRYPKDFQTSGEFAGMRQFLLESAEEAGSSAVLRVDDDTAAQYLRRSKVEMAVARAIKEQSFEVYYQPIYLVREKRIASLEALVRLRDEELGFIPPDEFIPLAERDGNIIHIGAQVLEECCSFLERHVLSNASMGIETIHVNISMAQCLRQNLPEMIRSVLEEHHIPPSMITLEITERTAISTPEQMRKHMKQLGELGVSFAMDDYGSGNSNCSYLIKFPFEEVKVDKDIVWASFEKDAARIILENEVRTMQEIGVPIIVEGIETKEQAKRMEELGVDFIQGYYYGRPMPEGEVLRYIRQFGAQTGE